MGEGSRTAEFMSDRGVTGEGNLGLMREMKHAVGASPESYCSPGGGGGNAMAPGVIRRPSGPG